MSVRISDRSESSCQYMAAAGQLASRIGQIVVNGPRKYLMSHGDHLVRTSLDLYMHCQVANSIYMGKGPNFQRDYELRRRHLLEARGMVDHLCAAADIFLGLSACGCEEPDEGDPEYERKIRKAQKARAKNTKRKHEVGKMCLELKRLLSGVIRSDYERFKKYNGGTGEARK